MRDLQQQDLDPQCYERADEHIDLSNAQLKDIRPGKVSAAMMYATARFNAYVGWLGFDSVTDMASARDETIDYFMEQYRLMPGNVDDYIDNFDQYRPMG